VRRGVFGMSRRHGERNRKDEAKGLFEFFGSRLGTFDCILHCGDLFGCIWVWFLILVSSLLPGFKIPSNTIDCVPSGKTANNTQFSPSPSLCLLLAAQKMRLSIFCRLSPDSFNPFSKAPLTQSRLHPLFSLYEANTRDVVQQPKRAVTTSRELALKRPKSLDSALH
jgi:hypothetical protein